MIDLSRTAVDLYDFELRERVYRLRQRQRMAWRLGVTRNNFDIRTCIRRNVRLTLSRTRTTIKFPVDLPLSHRETYLKWVELIRAHLGEIRQTLRGSFQLDRILLSTEDKHNCYKFSLLDGPAIREYLPVLDRAPQSG